MCDRCRAREAEFRREEVKGVIKREVRLVEEEEKREEDDEEETVQQLVEEMKQQYPMPGQIVIYCNTVKKTV